MERKYLVPKEVINFLYNGCVGFYPEIFFPEEEKQPLILYSGFNKEKFEEFIQKITNTDSANNAVQIIRIWKAKSDQGEDVFTTVPINLDELIESLERATEESQKIKETAERKTEEFLKAQERKILDPQKINLIKEEIELTSTQPQTTIKLTKEQQKIIAYAQADPINFVNELTERIIQKSNLNPSNPLEIKSTETAAQIFTLKVLELDPKAKDVVIDASPFEILAIFANPENSIFTSAVPDPETRKQIAEVVQGIASTLELDTTLTTNWINQATGVNWTPFFIPPQIRELKQIPEEQKGKTPGINVNLKRFLEQITTVQALERQIRQSIIDDKTYNQLTRIEKAKLDEAIKEAASRTSSKSFAFSFLTSKKPPFLENTITNQDSNWLNTHFSSIGITPQPTATFFTKINFGIFSSPNILNSPILNFAFDKIIQKLPATAKLKSVVSGLTTKITEKAAAKVTATKIGGKLAAALSANVIPVAGQIISTIATALSIKDITVAIGKWIKKNSDKLPYVLAGLLVGGFALTGAPLFLIAGLGVAGFASRIAIGTFVISTFTAISSAVLASLVAPMLIVFIGIPILVVIILFIINSSAYVYPPSTTNLPGSPSEIIQSEYINLIKKADADKLPNLTSTREINYTIQINPKKGAVTIKSIENKYNITGGNNPKQIQSPDLSSFIGKIIDSSQTLTFNYKINIDPSHNNSIIEDIITVVVATSDGKDSTASTSYSIIIGSPPIDCPIPNGRITWWSYQPGDENGTRHGNNRYWGSVSCRSWPLPQSTGCYGPSDPAASANKCFKETSRCSYYGYAIDVVGSNSVYAPMMGGQQTTWNCSFGFSNGGGSAGYTYICSSGQYRLILTHMKNNAKTGTINSGEKIGELYPMTNAHLHIELAINGQYVKPENYLCR